MSNHNKIVKYPKIPRINIGIVIFVVILFYVLYHVFAYLTAEHIAIYEVEYGTIAESNTYQGLLLRDETVYPSPYTGHVNYYLKDATKASVKTLICSVDETGSISSMIEQSASSEEVQKAAENAAVTDTVTEFALSYDSNTFFRVYDFKEDVKSQVMEAINVAALEAVSQSASYAAGSAGFHIVLAPEPGVAVYYVDGYETVTPENFTPEQMNELNYNRLNLKGATAVSAGDPILKMLTNEDWHIVLRVEDSVYGQLQGRSVIQIRFLSDNETSNASYVFRDIDGQHYMILTLNNSMIRYATDRFTEIELMMEEQTGLKIPNSAIVQKDFYAVPKDYFAPAEDSTDPALTVINLDEDGNETVSTITTELYDETEEVYYVREPGITEGTVIQKPESTERYVINDSVKHPGVYNVNKGFAVFKRIEPLYSNAEYTIVRTGTSYGVALYDHIALVGNEIQEGALVH